MFYWYVFVYMTVEYNGCKVMVQKYHYVINSIELCVEYDILLFCVCQRNV